MSDAMQVDNVNRKAEDPHLPWVEKYRPHSLDDIVQQDQVVRALRASIETANLPHLLFYGPAGTGKTSTILAVARDLFGPELMKKRVLELNASDERGINVVRSKIKDFAKISVSKRSEGSKYPSPPYKIIILDEADSMTKDAQSALRRTMELHSNITRFCLICNYVSKIIDPIASRCAKFRFAPLGNNAIMDRLNTVATLENIPVSEAVINEVMDISGGDLRKAINILQTTRFFSAGEGNGVDVVNVREIAGFVPPELVQQALTICLDPYGNFDRLQAVVKEIISGGYFILQALVQIQDIVISSDSLTNLAKGKICIGLAETQKRLSNGGCEYIQLLNAFSKVMYEYKRTL